MEIKTEIISRKTLDIYNNELDTVTTPKIQALIGDGFREVDVQKRYERMIVVYEKVIDISNGSIKAENL